MPLAKRKAWVQIENVESPISAHAKGKGVLLLTGHFGNFEVATVAGISQFPQFRGQLHFVRRPLKPRWLNEFITRRFRRAGFGTLGKRGSLEAILELLAHGAVVVYLLPLARRPQRVSPSTSLVIRQGPSRALHCWP